MNSQNWIKFFLTACRSFSLIDAELIQLLKNCRYKNNFLTITGTSSVYIGIHNMCVIYAPLQVYFR